jgi:hypothetical protein
MIELLLNKEYDKTVDMIVTRFKPTDDQALNMITLCPSGNIHIVPKNAAKTIYAKYCYIENLIRDNSKPGDVVFDPSMGAGTVGVAAINCDRSFVGVTHLDRQLTIANRRVYGAFFKKVN